MSREGTEKKFILSADSVISGRGAEVFGKGEVSYIALNVFSITFVIKAYSCILGVILKTKGFDKLFDAKDLLRNH